jgi:uncharacterized phage protein gp47/JayE
MPLTPVVATITPAGITAPSYADILAWYQQQFQTIYGTDAYIAPDSQDGELLAIQAQAVHDMNDALIAAYLGFSPTYAQGNNLSSLVKINGIVRQSPSLSTAVGDVVGVAGTVIPFGVVEDTDGNLWTVPPVTIPGGGSVAVTVIAQKPGAIAAAAGTINKINTPILGWQTFTSTSDAVPGAPVESDAALRRRQTTAASLPSQSPLAGVAALLANLPGVTRVQCYENDTGAPDANGLPANSIAVVIEGGDVNQIAEAIGQKKTMGAATYATGAGAQAINYTDPITGIVYTINFMVLQYLEAVIVVNGNQKTGWNSNVAVEIQNALAAYINSLTTGQTMEFLRLVPPAYLLGTADGSTYEITSITLNGAGIDVPVPFNKIARCVAAADVTINIV